MPDLRSAVRSALVADGALSALVGPRVRPSIRPDEAELPAVAVRLVDDDEGRTLAGVSGYAWARLQLDCWAGTLDAAQACAARARAVLLALRGEAGGVTFQWVHPAGRRDSHEPAGEGGDRDLYRVLLDFRVRYLIP